MHLEERLGLGWVRSTWQLVCLAVYRKALVLAVVGNFLENGPLTFGGRHLWQFS